MLRQESRGSLADPGAGAGDDGDALVAHRSATRSAQTLRRNLYDGNTAVRVAITADGRADRLRAPSPTAIVATNTSSLPITAVGAAPNVTCNAAASSDTQWTQDALPSTQWLPGSTTRVSPTSGATTRRVPVVSYFGTRSTKRSTSSFGAR